MKCSRSARKAFSVALLSLSMSFVASAQSIAETKKQADKEAASEQRAIEQLRYIAEVIRKCPDHQTAFDNGSGVRVYAPLNVVWDIEEGQSARSQKMGYVEFVQHSTHIPQPTEQCKKRDSGCKSSNEAATQFNLAMEGVQPLSQFRYEFDLGVHSLEFVRALGKHETDDNAHWVAISLNGCVGDAVLASVNDPLTATSRPPEIPEPLWEAANKGDAEAIRSIGSMYDSGQGVPQNYVEAIRWYRVAANKGDDRSMNRIGGLYYQGLGVSKNDAETLRWWRMAADQGNATAMETIGIAYYYGLGVTQNYEDAYFWLSLSASGPVADLDAGRNPSASCLQSRATCEKARETARKRRDDAARTLSPAKLAEVRERTQKWIETHPEIH